MICWSCERAAAEGPLCDHCGAILPVDPAADHFAVAGVERRYDLDLALLEARFRERSRKLHPDRFTTADPRARRASLQWSVKLNEARRVLKDPLGRAEYLLASSGIEIPSAAPPALLMEILELREELGEARAGGDDAKVQAMAVAMRQRLHAALQAVAQELTAASPAADALARAAQQLVAVRYFKRFMDEVASHDEALAGEADGAEAGGP